MAVAPLVAHLAWPSVDHIHYTVHRASYLVQKGGLLPQLLICLCMRPGKACSLALCSVQHLGELAQLILQLTGRLLGLGCFSLRAKAAWGLFNNCVASDKQLC